MVDVSDLDVWRGGTGEIEDFYSLVVDLGEVQLSCIHFPGTGWGEVRTYDEIDGWTFDRWLGQYDPEKLEEYDEELIQSVFGDKIEEVQ